MEPRAGRRVMWCCQTADVAGDERCHVRLRFRDRRSAVSAGLTVALLTAMEVSDIRRGTLPDDAVDDQGTSSWFGAAMSVAITASVISLVRDGDEPLPRRPGRWWTGLGFIWAGAAFNRWARRSLGDNYRSQLTIVHDHDVIDSGPYRLVRHPMYTGSTVICVGCALAVDACPASLAWALPVASLVHRVRIEERLLRVTLGGSYERFADGRARFVPGVW